MKTDWMVELQLLLARFPETGARYDIEGMTEEELKGLLRLLREKSANG